MDPAFAIRASDAINYDGTAAIRAHDGTTVLA
jgi:hypothetical protein